MSGKQGGQLSQTEALLGLVREGNREAFETIFHAYYGRVHAIAFRLLGSAQEADDVAQETFLRLYRRPLPPGRAHNLDGWLLRVATNLAYNVIRAKTRRQRRETRAWDQGGESAPDPDEELLRADQAGRVRQALAQLSERQVQLLLLRQAGLSYAELSAALGIAQGSVGTLLARAERAFREAYSGEPIDGSDGAG